MIDEIRNKLVAIEVAADTPPQHVNDVEFLRAASLVILSLARDALALLKKD